MNKKAPPGRNVIAQNRKARHNFTILETLEAGLVLEGTEVKSLRMGKASITESYASFENEGLYLVNATINEYPYGNRNNHHPTRPRKLLVKERELNRLKGAVQRKGQTLIPLSLYFNPRGIAKCELALATGKKNYDKRESEKQKDWNLQKARLLKEK